MIDRLTLGPLLYNWSPEKARDFYFGVADEMDVDRVYLGEVVCSKRQPFHETYWPEVVERLERAGKQVVFSTLALVTTEREIKGLRELCADSEDRLVEINDLTLLSRWTGKPFLVGPYVNIYNESALAVFEDMGAVGATLPFELPQKTLVSLASSAQCALEVQVFGRLPLAISARCYHARAFRLQKDSCRFVCDQHPDGMVVDTLDEQQFLTVNGTQTQSMTCVNLIRETAALKALGIRQLRLSPQNVDMIEVARVFRAVQRGTLAGDEAFAHLEGLMPQFQFSNGYFHGVEGRRLFEAS
ncbi:U32 family peptidase [Asticcacaulis sp. BYS171W]|uniref:Ubiquinone biosynthesis protein UbiV n=1 Tax=Asticcacaulis aquaticus TaxID=2984212 RepID=A0ABT5HWG9_9CAUL|nr:U32 family peptidase [Asticcacaulis aquaticus]MDC7684437.1 U32 family peptidase [Asticcacaulis aquaticus]